MMYFASFCDGREPYKSYIGGFINPSDVAVVGVEDDVDVGQAEVVGDSSVHSHTAKPDCDIICCRSIIISYTSTLPS